jgi:hypothetical protein
LDVSASAALEAADPDADLLNTDEKGDPYFADKVGELVREVRAKGEAAEGLRNEDLVA